MVELFQIVEKPRRCSYLPSEAASLEVRLVADMSDSEYADLLSRGYRRFGLQVFRPACPLCSQCRSIRVLVRDFDPSARDRRILRKNAAIRIELRPLSATPQHVELYNLYHRFMHEHRGWPLEQITLPGYEEHFLSGPQRIGRQWLYYEDDRLIGVALMDEAPDAISLVYCFYSPAWRASSPGAFSILNQLLYAKERRMKYAYLGYWIDACPSMSYKVRFQPHELLRDYPQADSCPVWG
jgi:arginine-tRNA-protein transferase